MTDTLTKARAVLDAATQGEWQIQKKTVLTESDGKSIAACLSPRLDPDGNAMSPHNARAICMMMNAAPELLDVIAAANVHIDDGNATSESGLIAAVDAALAKLPEPPK